MNQDSINQDKAKIANATEEQLSRIIGKYNHLATKQEVNISNLELAVEASRNKRAVFKAVVQAANIAMMKYNTVQLYTLEGKRISVDRENYDLFIKDGYIDGKVFIFRKVKGGVKVTDTLTIEEYQKVYGPELHKLQEQKHLGKGLYAVISNENPVEALLAELLVKKEKA